MRRFSELFRLLGEADGDGIDVLDPNQRTKIDAPAGVDGQSVTDDDVELVNIVLAALRVKLRASQRHFFMGEDFRNKSAVSKLAVVKKMVDAAKPVTEAVDDEKPDEPKEDEEPEQPDMGGGMPAEEEIPLEVEDIAETAVRALLEDPDVIRHALQDTPYKTDAQHYREVYKMVKSRLFY